MQLKVSETFPPTYSEDNIGYYQIHIHSSFLTYKFRFQFNTVEIIQLGLNIILILIFFSKKSLLLKKFNHENKIILGLFVCSN